MSASSPSPPELSEALAILRSQLHRGISGPSSSSELARSYSLLQTAAATGHAEALYRLANSTSHGFGVTASPSTALDIYLKSASQGHLNAQYEAALLYLSTSPGVAFNPSAAHSLLLSASSSGHTASHLHLGHLFLHFHIDSKSDAFLAEFPYSHEKAIHYYRLAAEASNTNDAAAESETETNLASSAASSASVSAAFQLGSIYLDGSYAGIPRNPSLAIEWLLKAAERGHSAAAMNLGFCALNGEGMNENREFAIYWLEKAASRGQKRAIKALGDLHWNGENLKGESDYGSAASWFAQAAAAPFKDPEAMRKLAYCKMQMGEDFSQIVQLLTEAASLGDPESAASLGAIYHEGAPGVERDFVRSAEFYRSAADIGLPAAQLNYGVALMAGKGVPANAVEAVRFFRLAASSGMPEARFHLAQALFDGSGTQEDSDEARRQLQLAAADGFEPASEAIRDWEWED